jgi:ribosomal protein S18 acetylase RimI-like enzyme
MNVRAADEGDADPIARVHVASWQKAYAGLMPDELLSSLDPAERAEDWRRLLRTTEEEALVAIQECEVVGVSYFGRARDEDAGVKVGEVQAIYVHPAYWRRGVGRVLLTESLSRLRARGFEKVTLWVLAENTSARRFYQRMGFDEDGAQKKHRGTGLLEVRYVKPIAGE